MAARIDTAALTSPVRCFSLVFLFVCLLVIAKISQANHSYSRLDILNIGFQCNQVVTSEFLKLHNILEEIARTPGSPWIVIGSSKSVDDGRGLLVRLKKQSRKPPLPSVFLANARSLANKRDELQLLIATNNIMKDCCILLITETWLNPLIPDAAMELAGRLAFRFR